MGSIAKQNIKNQRVKFLPQKQKLFLENILLKSKLSTRELAFMAGVHPRSFRDWKREKASMSLYALELFSGKFGEDPGEKTEALFERWKNSQKEANRVGGNATFQKHGSFLTPEGRRKGGKKAISILRAKGFVRTNHFQQPAHSLEFAEFVGIMLGDGGMTHSQCTITLNGEADKLYVQFVISFCERLFGVRPKFLKRKDSKAVVIYYNGRLFVEYLLQIGLHVGNKVKQQVDVPKWIKNNKEYCVACLRGLMDTDGGVFLHKYKVHGKQYIYKNISFTNKSTPLIVFVFEILFILGFTPKLRETVEIKKVWLYNEHEVDRYLKIVGTSNYRLGKYGEVA